MADSIFSPREKKSSPARHWLCLHFPELIGDAHDVTHADQAMAVVDNASGRPVLVFANERAQAHGIHAGMSLNSARGLLGSLRIQTRQIACEQKRLLQLTHWAQQFTPTISVQEPASLLLDIGASLVLFKGARLLGKRIKSELKKKRITVALAMAPTPLAALWLARANEQRRIASPATLVSHLENLSLTRTDIKEQTITRLNAIGATEVGDVLRLPRADMARRYGKELPVLLDKALGRAPDLPPPFTAPAKFCATHELHYECNDYSRLLPEISVLLKELCQQLQKQQQAIQSLQLMFIHHKTNTYLDIGLLQASRQFEHLLSLITTRIETLRCNESVRAVQLIANNWQASPEKTADYFSTTSNTVALQLLLEQLKAKLGEHAVFCLQSAEDYRPTRSSIALNPGARGLQLSRAYYPVFCLPEPQAIIYSTQTLRLLRGPHRIENGWWDGADTCRDYYVAQTKHGAIWWLFRQKTRPMLSVKNAPVNPDRTQFGSLQSGAVQQWFWHGIFA